MAPDYIFYRDPMWLNCSMIDLDYNQIYSIKWFKDNQEMYRFITADELTPRTFYDTTGIVIDESRSNYGNLYILQTDFKTEADFRCEVLAENDFTTAIQIKKIRVYYIPRDGQPIIVGKKSHFSPNEPVNLTCTSPMSTPPARLVINLNGNSLVSSNQNNIDDNQNNDVMKTNQIIMRTYYRHFENGQSSTSVNVQFPGSWLQAKRINQFECTSSIIHRFNRTANVRLEMKIDSSNNNNHTLYVPILDHHTNNDLQDRLSPKIENLKKKYELGEQISLRCLSSKYKPMPELYWLVNGQQLDAQFLDYNKQNDFNQNGFIRLDLKYPLNGKNQNNDNDDQNDNGQQQLQQQHYSYHQHQRRQHGNNLSTKRNSPNWNRRIQLSNSNNDDSFDSKYQSSSSILIDSYHFECIQVLSNVISVSSEVVQLYGTSSSSSSSSSSGSNNHDLEQSLHHGNAVEAVKSFIGNSAGSSSSLLFVKQINSFVLMMIIVSIYATMF